MAAPVNRSPPAIAATPAPPAAPTAAPVPTVARSLLPSVDVQAASGRAAAATIEMTALFTMLLLRSAIGAAPRSSGTRIGLPRQKREPTVRVPAVTWLGWTSPELTASGAAHALSRSASSARRPSLLGPDRPIDR